MDAVPNPPLAVLFGILFAIAGPIKSMPTFQVLSAGMEVRVRNMLAIKACALGALAIALAVLMVDAMAKKYAVSSPAIGSAAGLMLLVVGVLSLLGKESGPPPTSPIDAMGLAFPVLLPPYAFGLILLFAVSLPTAAMGLITLGAALMAMNAVAMIFADAVLKRVGMAPLRLLGAIFGILQVALGMQILFWGIAEGFGFSN